MGTKKEKNLPPQGPRNPRGRRGGAIVPGTPPPVVIQRRATGLKASPLAEMAIAKKKKASSARSGPAESTAGSADKRLWRSIPVVVLERLDKRTELPCEYRELTRKEMKKIKTSASFRLREWDKFKEHEYDVMTREETKRYHGSDSSLRSTASGTHYVTKEAWKDTWDSEDPDDRRPSPLVVLRMLDAKRAERCRKTEEATGEMERGTGPFRRTRLRGPRSIRERKEEKLTSRCGPEAGTSAPRVPELRPAPTASKTPDRAGPPATAGEDSDCSLSSAVSVLGRRRTLLSLRNGISPSDESSQRETRQEKLGKAANRASSDARPAMRPRREWAGGPQPPRRIGGCGNPMSNSEPRMRP